MMRKYPAATNGGIWLCHPHQNSGEPCRSSSGRSSRLPAVTTCNVVSATSMKPLQICCDPSSANLLRKGSPSLTAASAGAFFISSSQQLFKRWRHPNALRKRRYQKRAHLKCRSRHCQKPARLSTWSSGSAQRRGCAPKCAVKRRAEMTMARETKLQREASDVGSIEQPVERRT